MFEVPTILYFNSFEKVFEAVESGVCPYGVLPVENSSVGSVAAAYFFRGFYYFKLVQTFGGVPLDLGGGELHSNNAPKRTSVRNTVDEVYNKAVFPDLEKAVNDLPETSRRIGSRIFEAENLTIDIENRVLLEHIGG